MRRSVGRGLSSLIAISDDAFGRGMERFQEWVDDSRPISRSTSR